MKRNRIVLKDTELISDLSTFFQSNEREDFGELVEKHLDGFRELLDFLPENQKQPFVLRYIYGLNLGDIRKRLGEDIKTATYSLRIRYAYEKLKDMINKQIERKMQKS